MSPRYELRSSFQMVCTYLPMLTIRPPWQFFYKKSKNNFGSIEAAKVLLFLLNSGICRDGNISTVPLHLGPWGVGNHINRAIRYIGSNVQQWLMLKRSYVYKEGDVGHNLIQKLGHSRRLFCFIFAFSTQLTICKMC